MKNEIGNFPFEVCIKFDIFVTQLDIRPIAVDESAVGNNPYFK